MAGDRLTSGHSRAGAAVAAGLALLLLAQAARGEESAAPPSSGRSPESRATEYLAAAVRQWEDEEHCFACHHHGDGARALYRAVARGRPVEATPALDRWLSQPSNWDLPENGDPNSDQKLADLQFALALREGLAAGRLTDRQALVTAAERVARHLTADGSWPADPTSALGSPVTYGASLGTALARQVLAAADGERFRMPLERSREWLVSHGVVNVPAAAAVILGLSAAERRAAAEAVAAAAALLAQAQQTAGGWGSFPHTRPENFDTALALLAWAELRATPAADRWQIEQRIARGRAALVRQQDSQGGWRETTRPAGRESYAQHISTTAWATLALLETRPRPGGEDPQRGEP